MIKDGKGGARTKTGLKFEERVSLRKLFEDIPGYDVRKGKVFYNEHEVGLLLGKHALYKRLLEQKKVKWKEIISKKLLPDEAVLVYENNTLFIIEMKFQKTAGSVDEKLQTCDFKKKQYKKLLEPLKIEVEYMYILNDWFMQPTYKDVLNYVESCGCMYFFEELPLSTLGLPED